MPFGDPSDRPLSAPKPAQGEDVARSLGTGLAEGGAAFIGNVGDIAQLGKGAVQKAADFAKSHGFGDGKLPHLVPDLGTILNAAATGGAERAGVDPKAARMAAAIMNPLAAVSGGGSSDVKGAITHDQPLYQPQTKAGQYARTIAQFAPAAVMPGGAVRRAANVLVPAVASETAGQVTHDKTPELEPYARVAGALLGAGLTNVAGAPAPRTRILAEASRGASDAQVGQARQLMERAQAEGVRLTVAEALQQVTNGGTGMGRMQRVVEGTKAGTERFAPVMAQRPDQVRGALLGFADTVAPATDTPSMVGAQAQQAADQGLNGVRRFINSAAEPHYEALQGQEIPPAEYAQLQGDPSYQHALEALRAHPELGAQVAHLPDNNLAVVNEVVKRLNTGAEQVRPGPMNPQGDNGLAALRDRAAGSAADVAASASPDFAQARAGVAAGRQAYLEPLQRGPLGQIAGTDSVKAQTAALYPSQPLEGSADEIARAVAMLNSQNPTAAPALTRQFLANSANEATQQLQSGPNPWGGAKWAATQAGNPEQERALLAGVGGSGGDTDRLSALIEALRATGKRQPPGSLTAYNAKDIEELGKAGALGEVLRTGLNPPGAFRRIGAAFQDWQTERNSGRLADAILAQPDQAEQILMRARQVVPEGQGLDTIERLAIAAQQSRQPQQQLGGR